MTRRRWITIAVVTAAYGWVVFHAEQPTPTVARDAPSINLRLGLDRVKQAMGRDQPVGRGVVVAHVEGSAGRYLPDFGLPQFRTVRFIPESGRGTTLDHTTATAAIAWGNVGLAPGVSKVHCYSATDWLGAGCLRAGSADPPHPANGRVVSHSWIGEHPGAAEALRRLDYLIDRHDQIVVVGVNNESERPVPTLLASAYNAIAVGRYDGRNSSGRTRVDLPGRCKPDLVAPGSLTSFTVPVVSAMAARLLELADRRDDPGEALRAEVIKAVLLAGAEKQDGWVNAPERPLAERFGAGRVRLDHSVTIFDAGPTPAETIAPSASWSFQALDSAGLATWRIEAPTDARAISIVAVWHRRIDGRTVRDLLTGQPRWLDTPRLADVDLELWREPDGQAPSRVAESVSRVDNVEHIDFTQAKPGNYRIAIRRVDTLEEPWDVAVAWRVR